MIESLWRTRDRQLTFLLARDQVLQEVDRQGAFVRQVRLAVDREEEVAFGLRGELRGELLRRDPDLLRDLLGLVGVAVVGHR